MESHPYTEVNLEYAHVSELRTWANNLAEANPISVGDGGDWPAYEMRVRAIYMGVELTFMSDETPIHTIAIYGGIPTAREIAQYVAAGGFQ